MIRTLFPSATAATKISIRQCPFFNRTLLSPSTSLPTIHHHHHHQIHSQQQQQRCSYHTSNSPSGIVHHVPQSSFNRASSMLKRRRSDRFISERHNQQRHFCKSALCLLQQHNEGGNRIPPGPPVSFVSTFEQNNKDKQQTQQDTLDDNSLMNGGIHEDEHASYSIDMTDACAKRIRQVNEIHGNLNRKLRVTVNYGGCSGYKTDFAFTDTIEDDDVIFEKAGSEVVVDKESLKYIKGSTVDFVESLGSSKFQMQSNPNADSKCSCGSSFNFVDI